MCEIKEMNKIKEAPLRGAIKQKRDWSEQAFRARFVMGMDCGEQALFFFRLIKTRLVQTGFSNCNNQCLSVPWPTELRRRYCNTQKLKKLCR